MNELQPTILSTDLTSGRVDLQKSDFDRLVTEKGRDVILERAIKCPCKGPQTNALSSCKNCGGVGWIFCNPQKTRIVLQGIEVATKLQGWSEELRGMVRITAMAEEQLSFMDRITALSGTSYYSEVTRFNLSDDSSTIFAYVGYNVKEVIYMGLFVNDQTKLTELAVNTDYTIDGNIVKLNMDKYGSMDPTALSVTIRYTYAPVFHILEDKRETIQSYKLLSDGGSEKDQTLPISAYARRAHYMLDGPNLTHNRLLNNDYSEV